MKHVVPLRTSRSLHVYAHRCTHAHGGVCIRIHTYSITHRPSHIFEHDRETRTYRGMHTPHTNINPAHIVEAYTHVRTSLQNGRGREQKYSRTHVRMCVEWFNVCACARACRVHCPYSSAGAHCGFFDTLKREHGVSSLWSPSCSQAAQSTRPTSCIIPRGIRGIMWIRCFAQIWICN